MPQANDSLQEVARKFSLTGAADQWDRMYRDDTQRLDEYNFRLRRDFTVRQVLAAARPGARVLDLGCGAGPVITELRGAGLECVGADYSGDMLEFARQRLQSRSLDPAGLVRCDGRSTPFPDASFDVVVCLGVISYVEDYEAVLREIRRLLRPGGTVIISFRNRLNLLLSDPVAIAKHLLREALGRREQAAFKIGRFLDFRIVRARIEALGLKFVALQGIGFGPFCFAGRALFSERTSIRISRALTRVCSRLHLQAAFKWMTDVSIWVYRQP